MMPTLLLDVHLWCVLTQTGPNHPLKAIAHSPPCYRPESALPLTQDYYALGIEGRLASGSVFIKGRKTPSMQRSAHCSTPVRYPSARL